MLTLTTLHYQLVLLSFLPCTSRLASLGLVFPAVSAAGLTALTRSPGEPPISSPKSTSAYPALTSLPWPAASLLLYPPTSRWGPARHRGLRRRGRLSEKLFTAYISGKINSPPPPPTLYHLPCTTYPVPHPSPRRRPGRPHLLRKGVESRQPVCPSYPAPQPPEATLAPGALSPSRARPAELGASPRPSRGLASVPTLHRPPAMAEPALSVPTAINQQKHIHTIIITNSPGSLPPSLGVESLGNLGEGGLTLSRS